MKNSEIKKPEFNTETEKETKCYQNPLIPSYNIGDPFVMRYDGRYYLYPSTGADTPYWVYESTDLVNWSERMECVPIDEIPNGVHESGRFCEKALPAYAPEVTYYNGMFVMVTSLGGTGHHTFVAENPLGPFKRVSENWGCKIDGHIFVDNDGKWYFYSAHAQGGLHGFKMTSPFGVDKSTEQPVGAIIDEGNGTWTEGPMVVYHDGTYYLSYTGNHVCHTGYRIEYGVSYGDPFSYKASRLNPILVSTTKIMSGIGHSSSVKAPDLDSYYMIYHTRCMQRFLNTDRIAFNGDKMYVLGPTVAPTAAPLMPDIYTLFDDEKDGEGFEGEFSISNGDLHMTDGRVLSKESLKRDDFTMELTVKYVQSGKKGGAVFAYKDENNYGTAVFDTKPEELVITFVVDGEATEYREKLVRSFDIPYRFNALQAIQIEKKGNEFTFYVNDRLLAKHESALVGDRIGMICEGDAAFGYIGATAVTSGDSHKEHLKPIATQTGLLLARHAREYGFETAEIEETKEIYVKAKAGETYSYKVYAEKEALYSMLTAYKSEGGATLSVYAGDEFIKDIALPARADFGSVIARELPIKEGAGVITVYVKEGSADILYYKVVANVESATITDLFTGAEEQIYSYSDGIGWSEADGRLNVSGVGKRLWGSYMDADSEISVKAEPKGDDSAYGLLLRTQNPGEATFTKGANIVETTERGSVQGRNWMQGYYIELTGDKVSLYKCNYGIELLCETEFRSGAGKCYSLTASARGANITLTVDGKTVIDYEDAEPYVNGMSGLRSAAGETSFAELKIKPVK